jgi:hypothetical protein
LWQVFLVQLFVVLWNVYFGSSSDGGGTVIAKDEAALKMMRKCADSLNLSSHFVVSKKDGVLVELPMAADMEVHRGRDNRLYARLALNELLLKRLIASI